jgi:hypothetical protein
MRYAGMLVKRVNRCKQKRKQHSGHADDLSLLLVNTAANSTMLQQPASQHLTNIR